MQPMEFVDHFRKQGASAILRTQFEDAVAPAMEAAVRGGFRIVEFTLNTPNALDHIERFSRQEDLVVGAGTVLTVDEARSAIRAGAKFLVSPVVDEQVIDEAGAAGVAVMPGTHTPTEMLRAHRAGAPLQKLFPAPGSGPDYVRACLGPLPFLRIVPTSGVDGSNVGHFLAAGSWAVGFVASLFVAADLEAGRFDRIERRAVELLAAVRAARP
jgi:2-dehydro-3-deoxyphosphogluconate aldolase/(4S)-4-hydroxy-2-oxoglutarate aldolase